MEKHFFLNISSVNLVFYYQTGLIKPSCYFDKWAEDMQSKYNGSLLFSTKNLLRKSECSLEVVFNKDEVDEIKENENGFFLYNKPLPISRIKNIYLTKGKSKEIVFTIEAVDGFIPEKSIKEIEASSEEIKLPELNISRKENNWETKNSLYDKILGGFALMKIAASEDFKEYSDNYFNYLAYLNKSIKSASNKLDNDFDERQLQTIQIINDNPKSKIVFNSINYEKVIESNKGRGEIKRDRFTGNIKLDEINNNGTYILAVLSEYGDDYGKSFKIADFISNVIYKKFRKEVLEKLCLTFGINQGYKSFRNYYEINNNTLEVKFCLNSELDYSIIESIYQYIFNGKTDNSSFSYINSWCPKHKNNVDTRKFETVRIFDKEIIIKKKVQVGSQEYLQKLLENFSNTKIFDDVKSKFKTTLEKVFKDYHDSFEVSNQDDKHKINELEKNISRLENKLQTTENKLKNYSSSPKEKKNDSCLNNDKTDAIEDNQIPINIETTPNYLNQREKKLNNIKAISDLIKIAKYVGVKNYSNYRAKDLNELRELIIEKEKNALK